MKSSAVIWVMNGMQSLIISPRTHLTFFFLCLNGVLGREMGEKEEDEEGRRRRKKRGRKKRGRKKNVERETEERHECA